MDNTIRTIIEGNADQVDYYKAVNRFDYKRKFNEMEMTGLNLPTLIHILESGFSKILNVDLARNADYRLATGNFSQDILIYGSIFSYLFTR